VNIADEPQLINVAQPDFFELDELRSVDPDAVALIGAVPARHDPCHIDDVRGRCVELAREARRKLCALLGTEPLAPDAQVLQMARVRLPGPQPELSQRLFDEHRIEIPTMGLHDDLLRISIASYTEREDVERLLDALPGALES
jgi:selenocysteine lyase/cysteine desulfurase